MTGTTTIYYRLLTCEIITWKERKVYVLSKNLERLLFFRISTEPAKHLLDHHIFGRYYSSASARRTALRFGSSSCWTHLLSGAMLCIPWALHLSHHFLIFKYFCNEVCLCLQCLQLSNYIGSLWSQSWKGKQDVMRWWVLGHMCKTKTQVSLQICTLWSRRLLFIDINFTVSIQSIWKNKLEQTMKIKLQVWSGSTLFGNQPPF